MGFTRIMQAVSSADGSPPGDPCVMVIFGASGDLTRRLLMPALHNLASDGLLPARFAVVGMAMDELSDDAFRERMSAAVRTFATRPTFDEAAWQRLAPKLCFTPGRFDDPAAFTRLLERVRHLDAEHKTGGNVLFYLAVPPSLFGPLCDHIDAAGFRDLHGWKRFIVEKPFGTDLASARALNKQILAHWFESQIFRIDHYLGKETVQNILAFRFANAIFEPLWNHHHIDHIQFTVSESVSVEGRGGYYERAGVLRDMMQNHMFQVLSYVCMEPPQSFAADDVRDAKAAVLQAVRRYSREEVLASTVRGQYGAGKKPDGHDVPAYRSEPGVAPDSNTETFAALRLLIDNERWQGVPIYLRSGKALWKRGTEVVVQFKRPPGGMFGDARPSANRLVFHVQPDQAIETLLQAKLPGPRMKLQPVHMRFGYDATFKAARGTGYEVMLYSCMLGDATLFSRTDFVEAAWQIAQPILDTWAETPADDFPNYMAGTWGPRAAHDLMARDGRRWFEVVNREVLDRVPLFHGADPVLLSQVSTMLKPRAASAGAVIVGIGEPGSEMFLISRGEVEVLDAAGDVLAVLRDGDYFGEIAVLLALPRTATVRARTHCDLFVLERSAFAQILRDHDPFARAIEAAARERYGKTVAAALDARA
ncbi:MAG: glucose-6-phosphate dehydrogenase [Myxococcota bacterium]